MPTIANNPITESIQDAPLAPATSSIIQKLNHDLRSPLSAILGFAILLEDQSLSEEERIDYVGAVKRAAEQMLATLNSAHTLSATPSKAGTPLQPSVKMPQLLAGRRVLLADDEPRLRQLTKFCLEKGGAHVVVAANGQEAVEQAAVEKFDVVLMDMQMPVLDGFDAARILREQGYDGPIVAFTAHASAEEWRHCLAVGCSRYVSKPFEAEALVRELAAAIDGSTRG